MSRNLEIIATYRSERFRFENADSTVVIASAQLAPQSRETAKSVGIEDSYITIKGEAEEDELEKGVTYRFLGQWKDYFNRRIGGKEKQFHFSTFVQHVAPDRQSLVDYLSHAGKGNGVGPRKAGILVDKFGIDEVLDKCRQPLEVISAIGINQDQAERFADYLIQQKAIESALLDLDSLLAGKGFPKTLPRKLIKEFGNEAAQIVTDDPFTLMQFKGVGFKKADNLWNLLRKPANDVHRLAMCLWYGMHSDTSGSTWFPARVAVEKLSREIGCEIDYRGAIIHGKELAETSEHHYGAIASTRADINGYPMENSPFLWLSEYRNDQREKGIVDVVSKAFDEAKDRVLTVNSRFQQIPAADYSIWPNVSEIQNVSDHQREQLQVAIGGENSPIAILTGSPGTGKTYVVAQLLKTILRQGRIGVTDIVVGAPTGKAAVRLTETFQQSGIPITARTWHSHLFGLDAENGGSLPCRLMIGDECFPAGTNVDTPNGPVSIEKLRPGDSILNAFGVDKAICIKRKRVTDEVILVTTGKKTITTTKNHRFFTSRGFVVASELRRGDSIIQTTSAMRLLRKDSLSQSELRRYAFLQHELLNEMEFSVSGGEEQDIHQGAREKIRRRKKAVSEVGFRSCECSDSTNSRIKSNEKSIVSQKKFGKTSCYRTQAKDSRGERNYCGSAENALGTATERVLGDGVCSSNKSQTGVRFAYPLQDRHCKSRSDDCNRMRRQFSQLAKSSGSRQEKELVLKVKRVEGVEILEPSDPRLDRFRDESGSLYFYDIQSFKHRTFSVEGLLVHNCSMLDLELMYRVFAARPYGAHMLLVGDPYQLPPVGCGAPFRDLIDSYEILSGHLTKIERNAGEIVEICARIRDGKRWDELLNGNVRCHPARSPESQIEDLEALVRRHDKWEAQVLVPVNDKSLVSRKVLNDRLQKLLNPNGDPVERTRFRIGDKIVCTQNGWYQVSGEISQQIDETDINDRSEVRIANGELAEIVNVHPKGFIAKLESPRRHVIVTVGKDSGKDAATDGDDSQAESPSEETSKESSASGLKWELGYALSCHKAQGSEFPYVYIMIDEYPGARSICDASWVMTAISRAKQECHLIGIHETAQRWCRSWKIGERKTFLKERLIAASVERELEAI